MPSLWQSVKKDGQPVTHEPATGETETGGYVTDTFGPGQEILAVVRPDRPAEFGITAEGEVDEVDLWAATHAADNVVPDDRLTVEGTAYRVIEPQKCSVNHIRVVGLQEDTR